MTFSMYNVKDNKKIQRSIDGNNITGILVSGEDNNFVVIVENEYDYWYRH